MRHSSLEDRIRGTAEPLIDDSRGRFVELRLRANTAEGDRFYRSLGFRRVDKQVTATHRLLFHPETSAPAGYSADAERAFYAIGLTPENMMDFGNLAELELELT